VRGSHFCSFPERRSQRTRGCAEARGGHPSSGSAAPLTRRQLTRYIRFSATNPFNGALKSGTCALRRSLRVLNLDRTHFLAVDHFDPHFARATPAQTKTPRQWSAQTFLATAFRLRRS
jgi:hypothetical protein